jgi:hypothetical protein
MERVDDGVELGTGGEQVRGEVFAQVYRRG